MCQYTTNFQKLPVFLICVVVFSVFLQIFWDFLLQVWCDSRSQQGTDQRVIVLTLKFLALKNWFFPSKKYLQIFFLLLFYLFTMQLFSADPTIFWNASVSLSVACISVQNDAADNFDPSFIFSWQIINQWILRIAL